MEIGLIVAIIILLLGLIFILLLYKEAKNNVVIIENEKEEMCKKMTDTIQEKDSEILRLIRYEKGLKSPDFFMLK